MDAADSLIIFQIALLAATFVITVDRKNTYVVEIFIMLYMYFIGLAIYLACALMPGVYGRNRKTKFSFMRGFIQCVSTLVMGMYCVWFLIKRNIFIPTPCGIWIYPQRQLAYVFLGAVGAGICVFILLPMAAWAPDAFTIAERWWRYKFPQRTPRLWPKLNAFGRATFG